MKNKTEVNAGTQEPAAGEAAASKGNLEGGKWWRSSQRQPGGLIPMRAGQGDEGKPGLVSGYVWQWGQGVHFKNRGGAMQRAKDFSRTRGACVTLGQALKELLEGEGHKALAFCAYSLCSNWVEAEELVQEACFRALRRASRYDGRQPLLPWVERILKNAYFDWRRGSISRGWVSLDNLIDECDSSEDTFAETFADGETSVLDRLIREEDAAISSRRLAGLPAKYREALTLCELEGIPYHKAANILGVRRGTIASRVHRGRALLAKLSRSARRSAMGGR
jgi:RNA polymerase sigma-70 factor (ECF subfamily)